MTARSARELAVGLTASLALAGLATEPAHAVPAGLGVLAIAAAPWLRGWLRWVPWTAVTLVALASLTWGVVSAALDPGPALAWAAAYLLAHRALSRLGPADDRVALLLSAIVLALAATRAAPPGFGLAVVGWAVLLPVALLAVAVDAEAGGRARPPAARNAGVVAVAVGGFGLLLFLVLPRSPVSADRPALTGFSDDVRLGDLGELLPDPTIALWVRPSGAVDPTEPVFLRGLALERFDGRTWSRRQRGRRPPPPRGSIRLDIAQEAIGDGVLFSAGTAPRVEVDGRAVPWVDGAFRDPAGPRRVGYAVFTDGSLGLGASAPESLSVADRVDLLALPEDLPQSVGNLAASVVGDLREPLDVARAIRAHLVDHYAYTTAPLDDAVEDPLPEFLFVRRTGHCEYFATALAVLLRARGVPSRVVTGFAGPDWDEAQQLWVVRRAHAHAWVELWAGDRWVSVDATPTGPAAPDLALPGPWEQWTWDLDALWEDAVVGYSADVQVDAVTDAGRWAEEVVGRESTGVPWVGLALLGLGLSGLVALLGRLLRRAAQAAAGEHAPTPRGRVARAHERARIALRRRGWRIPESLPPVAAARWLAARAGPDAEALERLAWLHYAVRFGGEDDAIHAAEARRLVVRVAALPGPSPSRIDAVGGAP